MVRLHPDGELKLSYRNEKGYLIEIRNCRYKVSRRRKPLGWVAMKDGPVLDRINLVSGWQVQFLDGQFGPWYDTQKKAVDFLLNRGL